MRANRAGYNNSYNKRAANSYGRNIQNNRSASGSRTNTRSKYVTTYGRSSVGNENIGARGYTRASMGRRTGVENRTENRYGYYGSGYSEYNATSVASDYYYEQDFSKSSKKRVKQTAKKEIRQLNMPKTIASIAVVFTLSLALLCSYAVNSSYRGEISSKQAELAEIQEENQYLETTLEDNVDLNKIAREAEKLGLQKPQAYQITEVQVPNESYTVQYDAKISTQDKSVWEFIKSLLNK